MTGVGVCRCLCLAGMTGLALCVFGLQGVAVAKEGWSRHTQSFQHAQRPFCLPLASTVGLAVKPIPFTHAPPGPQQVSADTMLSPELPTVQS